jgi:phage baseplate assembly protein W
VTLGFVDFVGAGWAFPVTTDPTGDVALVVREREIDQAIRIILGTARGERPMRPEFGCRIHDHVFGPANGATAGQISYDVREALEQWEPRIDVLHVNVVFDDAVHGRVYIDVGYRIADSNDPRNLVFPFYVIPDHEAEQAGAVGLGGDSVPGAAALNGSRTEA